MGMGSQETDFRSRLQDPLSASPFLAIKSLTTCHPFILTTSVPDKLYCSCFVGEKQTKINID